MFSKFLEFFFTQNKTPPKVKNSLHLKYFNYKVSQDETIWTFFRVSFYMNVTLRYLGLLDPGTIGPWFDMVWYGYSTQKRFMGGWCTHSRL